MGGFRIYVHCATLLPDGTDPKRQQSTPNGSHKEPNPDIGGLPMITPILQSRLLCAHDISVPVESFRIAITAMFTSYARDNGVVVVVVVVWPISEGELGMNISSVSE